MHASLKDAARRSGLSEETIRRKILTGEIAAIPVDDDRQYLVRLEDLGVPSPPEAGPAKTRAPYVCLRVAFGFFLVTLLAAIVTTAVGVRYGRAAQGWSRASFCLKCAVVRQGSGCCSAYMSDNLTETISGGDPAPCRHEWVSLVPRTGKSLRLLAEEMDRMGILEAARKVDPRGAADLVRWCLGREGAAFVDRTTFATRDEFRVWFDDLRARAAR